MPVTSEIDLINGLILCWHVAESTEELEHLCVQRDIILPPPMHLESRRKQVMATSLLHAQLFPGTILSYTGTGKPVIDSNNHVSISHSGEMLVMMKSSIPCGIDIERIHSRVQKVRHKFLNDDELVETEHASDHIVTQYWTSKEAMFKVSGSDRVFMRSNIFVRDLNADHATAVLIDGAEEIRRKIRFHVNEDMILAWTEACDEE